MASGRMVKWASKWKAVQYERREQDLEEDGVERGGVIPKEMLGRCDMSAR